MIVSNKSIHTYSFMYSHQNVSIRGRGFHQILDALRVNRFCGIEVQSNMNESRKNKVPQMVANRYNRQDTVKVIHTLL